MTQEELNEVIRLHGMWLRGEDGGEYADLENADLRYAYLENANLQKAILRNTNLQYADLRDADLRDVDLENANLQHADLQYANLQYANLQHADLQYANMKNADLKNADWDYSCVPLWCGSLSAHFDDQQLKQIAYHLVKAGLNSENASEETKNELAKLIDFANGFHRAEECGKIEHTEKKR